MTIINQITSFKISGFSFNGTDTQLNYTAGVTGGTALPSKALVLNASSNLTSGLNSLTATSLVSTNLTVNGTTFTSSILNNLSSLDGITAGTAAASKALIVDSSRNIININNLTATNLTGTLQTASQPNITSVGTLTSLVSNGNLNIAQHNGTTTGLQLSGTLVVATAVELNKLSGLTSSTTELNRLTGLTSSTIELNLLSGVTATTNQLNFVSGVTAGTVMASKAMVVNGSREITNMGSITSTGNFTLSTGRLFLANSISGLSHKYTTGGSTEIITSTNGGDTNYIGTSTDNDFSLAVNSTRYLTIKKTTGQVGIGTNSPNQELEVSDLSGNCLRLTNSGGSSYMDITINNQGISTLTLSGSAPAFNFSHALSTLSNTASTNTTTGALIVAGGAGIGGAVNVGGNINITGTVTSTNKLTLTTTLVDIITLNNSSSSGICNLKFNGDTRDWELGIRNSAQTWPSSFYLYDTTSAALRLLINSSGNVGLGTATPTTRLDVAGTIRNTTNLLYAQTSTTWTGTSYEGTCSSNGIITMTNTSVANNGTISLVTANHLNQITLAAQNTTVTTTNATSLYIANAPTAGTNMTITNAYSLMINAGRTLLNDNTSSTNTTSGALIVTGGVGIGGAVNIGGALSVTGNITGTLATSAQPNITSVGTLTSLSTGSLTINGTPVTATASELNWLDITSAGTAEASKALVLDSSRNIININALTATNLTGTLQTAAQPNITSTGNLTLPASLTITNGSAPFNITNTSSTSTFILTIQNTGGHQDIGSFTAHDVSINTNNIRRLTISSAGNVNVTGHNGTSAGLQLNGTLVTATAAELNYLDITTSGTAEASKAVVLDSSRNITNINNITSNSTGDAITLSNATTTSRQNIKFISDARTWELGSRGSGASNPDTFYLWDNNNSAMRFIVSSSGNMGIANNSPAYRLDVGGTINTSGSLRTSIAGTGFSHYDGTINLVSVVNNSTNPGIAYFGTATSHALVLQTNNTEHLRISSTGVITTARTFSTSNSTASSSTTTGALTVTGGVGIGGAVNIGASSTIAGALTVGTVGSGPNRINFSGTTGDANSDHTVITERIYGGTEQAELLLFKGNDPSTTPGPDRIRMRAAEFRFQTYTVAEDFSSVADTNNRLFIANDGNVGINTVSPGYKLDVSGDIRTNNLICNTAAADKIIHVYNDITTFYGFGANGNQLRLQTGGASGFGFYTGSSSSVLGTQRMQITETSTSILQTTASSSSTTGALIVSGGIGCAGDINTSGLLKTSVAGQGFSHNDGTINLVSYVNNTSFPGVAYFGPTTNHGLVLQTNNIERVRITTTGYVGIGGTNPTVPLEIFTSASKTISYGYLNSSGVTGTGSGSNAYSLYCIERVAAKEFNAHSDIRLKTDISNLDSEFCKNFIFNNTPVKYKFKNSQKYSYGYIAQDLLKKEYNDLVDVVSKKDTPELIDEDNFVSPKDAIFVLNYNNMIPILANTIKTLFEENKIQENNNQTLNTKVEEQNVLIQNLQNENNLLKTQINNILSRLEELEK